MRLGPLRNELQIDLREQGVAAVTCTYSGSDDEGFLNRPRLYTAAGQLLASGEGTPLHRLSERIEDFLDSLLESTHPGWEINDGADGKFEWDIASGKIAHTHHDHYMTTETSEDEL